MWRVCQCAELSMLSSGREGKEEPEGDRQRERERVREGEGERSKGGSDRRGVVWRRGTPGGRRAVRGGA